MPHAAREYYSPSNVQNVILAIVALVALLVLMLSVPNGASLRKGMEMPQLALKAEGTPGTLEYQLFYVHGETGEKVSPWHNIPLRPPGNQPGVYRFVCEIPKGSRPKFEINKETPYNPIKQDTKKGKLREYPMDSTVNYGAFPQTWEDPEHRERGLDLAGDNDPLDVLDLSSRPCSTGDVYEVKVIGALALVDGGEMDWKIVTVRVGDPLAESVYDVVVGQQEDAALQQRLDAIRTWFRDYKIPDGKPPNEFAFEGRYLSREVAIEVVEAQYDLWERLVRRPRGAGEDMWWPDLVAAGAGSPSK